MSDTCSHENRQESIYSVSSRCVHWCRYERLGLPQPAEATDAAVAACTVLDTEAGMKMARDNGRGGVVDMVQRSKWIEGLNKYKAAQQVARRNGRDDGREAKL